jgi:hypothetical protein
MEDVVITVALMAVPQMLAVSSQFALNWGVAEWVGTIHLASCRGLIAMGIL